MNHPVIKFSYRYPKLFDSCDQLIATAVLLDVTLVEMQDLHPTFLAYDTNGGAYRLPKSGSYLQLLFLKPSIDGLLGTNLFTTLRRADPGKHGHYASLVGKEFQIEIQDTGDRQKI